MKRPDTILDEVHEIRQRIEEKTKGMTSFERTTYFNKSGEDIAREYGLKRVLSASQVHMAASTPQ